MQIALAEGEPQEGGVAHVDVEDLKGEVERLRAAGVANICFNLGTVNDLPATLDLFGREVLPAFADSP